LFRISNRIHFLPICEAAAASKDFRLCEPAKFFDDLLQPHFSQSVLTSFQRRMTSIAWKEKIPYITQREEPASVAVGNSRDSIMLNKNSTLVPVCSI
jgi:hypothetical protein